MNFNSVGVASLAVFGGPHGPGIEAVSVPRALPSAMPDAGLEFLASTPVLWPLDSVAGCAVIQPATAAIVQPLAEPGLQLCGRGEFHVVRGAEFAGLRQGQLVAAAWRLEVKDPVSCGWRG